MKYIEDQRDTYLYKKIYMYMFHGPIGLCVYKYTEKNKDREREIKVRTCRATESTIEGSYRERQL